jgi:pyruvate,orthophosphate dikinase
VVAGIRTPKPIDHMADRDAPQLAKELEELRAKLETHYKEVQDFEFTIEQRSACSASRPATAR